MSPKTVSRRGPFCSAMLGINLSAALVFSEAIPMRYVLPLIPLLAVLSMGGLESHFERDGGGEAGGGPAEE